MERESLRESDLVSNIIKQRPRWEQQQRPLDHGLIIARHGMRASSAEVGESRDHTSTSIGKKDREGRGGG